MKQKIQTIIIGGGQAGLATSYYLSQQGHEHIVLEQAAQAGNAWRNDRWESFALLTPNWAFKIPGAEYQGDSPHGFLLREEVVAIFEMYVARYRLPVEYQTRVTAVEARPDGGYVVQTDAVSLEASNVVIATGMYQRPRLPVFHAQLAAPIVQLHSGSYRNPGQLPPGAVLVVGSAQSGCQIAEELYQSGRQVYLCIGSAGRVPRRYRGRDTYEWLYLAGFMDRTPDQLPSPRARFSGNPHVSGRDGGRTLNLHQFARDGVKLLGRIQDGRENKIWLAGDLKENLAKADEFEAQIVRLVDGYITQNGLDAPTESLPVLRDGYMLDEQRELDLQSAGVTSVIWALGYSFDYSLVRLPVTDEAGFPLQQRGVTAFPGLYFIGMPWLYKQKSGLLMGVGEDAQYLASVIASA
jgi:putative flavoprotein involved in K+ transport